MIDLHMHSIFSDGTQTPSEVVKLAAKNGGQYLSLTDHDTVNGIAEAIQTASLLNVKIIPGIEISVHTEDEEVHLLAYNFNWQDHNLNQLLQKLKLDRENRMQNMVHKLNHLGLELSLEEVRYFLDEGSSAGRPHVAKALLKKGHVKSTQEAFEKYLKKGKPAYAPREKVDPKQMIQNIKDLGGITSLAHPGLIKNQQAIYRMIEFGVGALEVYHPDHNPNTQKRLIKLCEAHQLKITGGSDWHGPDLHNNIEPGKIQTPPSWNQEILTYLAA